eukprot:8053185-Ditylum_brightwellii.AAC.1
MNEDVAQDGVSGEGDVAEGGGAKGVSARDGGSGKNARQIRSSRGSAGRKEKLRIHESSSE